MSNAVAMRTIVMDMCGSTTVDDNAFPRLLVLVGIMESDSILFNLVVDGAAHFLSLTKCVISCGETERRSRHLLA